MPTGRRLQPSLLRLGDFAVLSAAFATALLVSANALQGSDWKQFLSIRVSVGNILLFLGFAMVWHLLLRVHGLYSSRRLSSVFSEWWDITRAVFLGTLILPLLGLVLSLQAVNRSFIAAFFAVALTGTLVLRSGLRWLLGEARRRGRNLRNVVIVGCGPRGARLGAEIRRRPDLGYLLLGYIDDIPAPANPSHEGAEKLLGSLDEIEELLTRLAVDDVLVALPVKSQYERISSIIGTSEQLGLTVRMPADFFRLQVAQADLDYLDAIPIVTLRTPTPSVGALIFKRLLDVVVSGAALVLLMPLFCLIAIAIKIDSPGPILFSQERVGLGRRLIRMLKFRTMVVDAEDQLKRLEAFNEAAGAVFKMRHDPRVTRVGRLLRKLSLDELPQLWNVLTGDMSLVGPRPLPVRDVRAFDSRWQNRRFSVKPGLTCLWQANGRHEIAFDEWMELDLQYIDQWSLKLDFEILLKTIPAVFRGTGAT
jgi:exopolysaccharide biosynthesis polyprenyl glycosylphosphotransferase